MTHDNRILHVADGILTLEDGRIVSFTSGIASNASHLLGAFLQLHRKGELLRYVHNLSDKQFIEVAERVTLEFEQLLRTLELGNTEALRALLDEMLESFALKIKTRLNADRVTLFVVNFETGTLYSKIAQESDGGSLPIEIPMSSGIAGYVASTGETLNVTDAYTHPTFNPEVDVKSGYRTRSVLCMPIKDSKGRVFAVAQLLNKLDNTLIVESWTRLRHRWTDDRSSVVCPDPATIALCPSRPISPPSSNVTSPVFSSNCTPAPNRMFFGSARRA